MHRQHKEADAPVFRHIPIGPGHQHAVVGGFGERRPHLLPVDHPLVTVALGPSAQAGQIRPRAGFAVEQAPLALAADRRRNQPSLCSSVPTSCSVQAKSPTVVSAAMRADRSESAATSRDWASETPRPRTLAPAGDRPSGIDDDVGPVGAVDVRTPVGRQPISDLVAQLLVSHSSGSDLLQVALPVPRWAAQQLGVASGSAQIQVRRMLPSESDAAVYLDAGRRDEDEGISTISSASKIRDTGRSCSANDPRGPTAIAMFLYLLTASC